MERLPVGIQVYGLRDLLDETPDQFPIVMQQIKDLGYDGIELAGLYGLDPLFIKNVLEKIGLVPISAHVPLADMMADPHGIGKTYQVIGCKYIVIPYLPEEYRPNTEGYAFILEEIARIGEIMLSYGLTLLYHNHDFEFVKMSDGIYGFDDIYRQIPEKFLQAEPDTCWIEVAGQSAVQYVKRYGGRCPVVHLKDYIMEGKPGNLYKLIGIEAEENEEEQGIFEFRPVGFGKQIWEPILNASLEAGVSWVIVEQDEHYDLSCMECARRSRDYLKILNW